MSSEPSHRKVYLQLRKSLDGLHRWEGVTCARGSFSLNQRGKCMLQLRDALLRRKKPIGEGYPLCAFNCYFILEKGKPRRQRKVRSHRARVGVEEQDEQVELRRAFGTFAPVRDAVMVNACPCALVIY